MDYYRHQYPDHGDLYWEAVELSPEEIWKKNRDETFLVKCTNCCEEIGEIRVSYGPFSINCVECAIEEAVSEHSEEGES